jgi:hypothetical protein
MKGTRNLIRSRSGRALALCVAYSLAIQALIASVGLGMSVAAAPGHVDFVICSIASGSESPAQGSQDDRNRPNPRPECPFCFVAAQSASYIATIDGGSAFPVFAGLHIAGAVLGFKYDGTLVTPFRRSVGDPRAPPVFSV